MSREEGVEVKALKGWAQRCAREKRSFGIFFRQTVSRKQGIVTDLELLELKEKCVGMLCRLVCAGHRFLSVENFAYDGHSIPTKGIPAGFILYLQYSLPLSKWKSPHLINSSVCPSVRLSCTLLVWFSSKIPRISNVHLYPGQCRNLGPKALGL